MPEMNVGFDADRRQAHQITPAHINLGLAIDMQKKDGTRQLARAEHQGRRDDGLRRRSGRPTRTSCGKARDGRLTVDDFAGTTISLTNPGTIGTDHSVPRLMRGQGAIVGVGAMEYPPE